MPSLQVDPANVLAGAKGGILVGWSFHNDFAIVVEQKKSSFFLVGCIRATAFIFVGKRDWKLI